MIYTPQKNTCIFSGRSLQCQPFVPVKGKAAIFPTRKVFRMAADYQGTKHIGMCVYWKIINARVGTVAQNNFHLRTRAELLNKSMPRLTR